MYESTLDISKKSPKRLSNSSWLVHILVAIFGTTAWIDVNGIFIQLPIISTQAPEKLKLSTYVVVAIQLANIAPLLYTYLARYKNVINEKTAIAFMILSDSMLNAILAYTYNWQPNFLGARHSVGLIGVIFFVACITCTSPISFLPFIQSFDEVYVVSYFVGQALSGVIPSVMAIAQGVSECNTVMHNTTAVDDLMSIDANLRFTPRDYFLIMSVFLFVSFCGFIVLNRIPEHKKKKDFTEVHSNHNKGHVSRSDYWNIRSIYLFLLLGITCALSNSILASTIPYATSSYGLEAYSYAIIISESVNPISCLLGLWVLPKSVKTVSLLFLVEILLTSNIVYLALKAPNPPLVGTIEGKYWAIISVTLVGSFISYVRMSISSIFRATSEEGLFYVGVVIQSSSFLGAVLSYVIIEYTSIIEQYDVCKIGEY